MEFAPATCVDALPDEVVSGLMCVLCIGPLRREYPIGATSWYWVYRLLGVLVSHGWNLSDVSPGCLLLPSWVTGWDHCSYFFGFSWRIHMHPLCSNRKLIVQPKQAGHYELRGALLGPTSSRARHFEKSSSAFTKRHNRCVSCSCRSKGRLDLRMLGSWTDWTLDLEQPTLGPQRPPLARDNKSFFPSPKKKKRLSTRFDNGEFWRDNRSENGTEQTPIPPQPLLTSITCVLERAVIFTITEGI